MHPIARLDHEYVWHPFTQMRDWLKREPIVIVAGQGARLLDVHGREYLDANASIWTNLHGHNCPPINAAIRQQLRQIAHSSALGLANVPASRLAEKLVRAANRPFSARAGKGLPMPARDQPVLRKVFFSDDGSTAMEVALKLAYGCARRQGDQRRRPAFLSLQNAYHGDTMGAVALGHIDLFHRAWSGLRFRTDAVMAPYCYRCRFNRATPERADAREYRQCNRECLSKLEAAFAARRARGKRYAAFVFEPLIQGAAGMIAQPAGWLREAAKIARSHGVPLIADEVMTAFRVNPKSQTSNLKSQISNPKSSGFACHHEGVQADYLVLAKGLTGGYLPMAATLTTAAVFEAYLGEYAEFKTFFHGHSYTANQLGAAAALASLDLLDRPASSRARGELEENLRAELRNLWTLPNVGDIRQVGLIAGIELVRDWRTRRPFALAEAAGIRVCEAMARRGVLTRPIGNVIVLMPPFCTTRPQLARMVSALGEAIEETLGRVQLGGTAG